jgi:Tfp pilus assembly protein PilN
MIEINLVPDVKQELIKAQRTRSTVIAGAVLVGIASAAAVAILAIYVFGVQTLRSSLADSSISTGIKKLKAVKDLSKTLTIQNQLTKISDLNASKNINSRIFDVLLAVIPPAPDDIKVSTLRIDSETGTISIEGQAPNSYPAVEVFKKTLEGAKLRYKDSSNKSQEVDLASDISISDTSYGSDSSGAKVLRFSMSFVYAPELFAPASKDTTIAIIVNGNVTDSYIGIPKSIFADRAIDLTETQ